MYHHYPHPAVRRLVSRLLAVSIGVLITGAVIQLLLAFTIGPLFFGTTVFTLILLIPILQRTVLHPEITITGDGLRLQPMIWQAQDVRWDALEQIVAHPLLYNDAATARLLHGRQWKPREGAVVVVKPEARLWPIYRLVGSLAGVGNLPAFAISSTTHTDYAALIGAIRAHVEPSETLSSPDVPLNVSDATHK